MDADPHSKQRRTTKRSEADESDTEESPSAPESQNFPKFIIIIPTDPKTISDLHLSGYRKLCKPALALLHLSVKLEPVIIQTANAYYSRRLLALTDLAGVPVRAEPHRTLNSCKGVIRCSDLKGLTKDEIVDGLRSQEERTTFISLSNQTIIILIAVKQTHLFSRLILISGSHQCWIPSC